MFVNSKELSALINTIRKELEYTVNLFNEVHEVLTRSGSINNLKEDKDIAFLFHGGEIYNDDEK